MPMLYWLGKQGGKNIKDITQLVQLWIRNSISAVDTVHVSNLVTYYVTLLLLLLPHSDILTPISVGILSTKY